MIFPRSVLVHIANLVTYIMLFKKQRKKIAKSLACCLHPKTIDQKLDDDMYSYKKVIVLEDSNSTATSVVEETFQENVSIQGRNDSITDDMDDIQTDAHSEEELPPPKKPIQTDNLESSYVNLEIRLHPEWEHDKEDMLRIFRCLTDQSLSLNNITKKVSKFPKYIKELEDKLQAFQYSLQNILQTGCKQRNSQYEDTLDSRPPEEHDERYGSIPNSYLHEVFSTETNHLKDQFDELKQCAEKMRSTCDDPSINSAISERVNKMNNEIKRLPEPYKLPNHALRRSLIKAGYIRPRGQNTQTQVFEYIEMKALSHNRRCSRMPTQYDSSTLESKM